MKLLVWLICSAVVFIGILFVLALPVWLDAEIPLTWCLSSETRAICYRSWLGSFSGWAAATAALVAAIVVYVSAHRQTTAQEQQRLHAARVALVSHLEMLSRKYNDIIYDVDNFRSSKGNAGQEHHSLPLPFFDSDTSELSVLPPKEAEGLFRFARDLVAVNDHACAIYSFESPSEAEQHIRVQAANAALKALKWRDRLADKIGWQPMWMDPGRKKSLAKIVADDLKKAEAEVE